MQNVFHNAELAGCGVVYHNQQSGYIYFFAFYNKAY